MKAGRCLCCALTIGVLMFGVTAFGQEIEWMPVWADVGYTINGTCGDGAGNEIVINAAPATVVMEIKLTGWAASGKQLGAYQGTLDATGYSSGSGGVLAPCYGCCGGVEITDFGPPPNGGGGIDTTRPDFVFFGKVPVAAVSLASLNFEFGSTQMGGAADDMGDCYYGGTLCVSVPGDAAGTYTLDWNPSDTKTFFNDQNGMKIDGLIRTTGAITIPEGACCYGLPTPSCVYTTESDCYGNPAYASPKVWTEVDLCPLDGGPDCPSCLQDSDCNDFDDCTDDTCVSFVCYNTPNYDPAYCCNPDGAALTEIDDGNECTEDICDMDTGVVTHPPRPDGYPCTSENACVINDHCDGAGNCIGDLPPDLMTPCVDDPDCPAGWFCEDDPGDPMFEYCNCRLETPLDLVKDADCVEEGETVYMTLTMGAGSAAVTGFQALMTYDPCCVEFVSIGPCPDSIFSTIIDWWVDEEAGLIWYAAIAYVEGEDYDPGNPVPSTTGPYDLACMEFIKLGAGTCPDYDECAPNEFCIISDNPYNTLLTNDRGQSVSLAIGGDDGCWYDATLDTPLNLYVPDGAAVNSDCGVAYANVTWDTAPYAEDVCNEWEMVCDLEHDGGIPLDPGLIMHGGMFPQGKTYFVCTATDIECGGEVTGVWTVDVSDQHALDVEVHLGPTMVTGMYTRCICFYLYDSSETPEPFCTEMEFGGPWNFADHARKTIKIDKGNYVCIEARDPLHTLRSTADVECIDNAWTAVFKGDPALQYVGKSHWLVGGNLDFYEPGGNPDVIDVLDFGVYMFEVSMNAMHTAGGNDCAGGDASALYPHADINADGFVDALDYAFLTKNYLADSKHGCFEDPGSVVYTPVLDITIKELRARGLSHLAVGDLNNDGRLNGEDMALYTQGVVPTPMKVDRLGR